jgi:acyl-CoA synthetase (AMP-forming)/AMP-acid ligase II
MNPMLLKIAKFLSQRPKDTTIRLLHIFSGIIIIGLLWIAQGHSVLDMPFIGVQIPEIEKIIQYGFLVL